MDFFVHTIPENMQEEVSFLEYNTKTRMGIWACLLMMLLVLCFVLTGVFKAEEAKTDHMVNATQPDDAIYVDAKPYETSTEDTEDVSTTEQTEAESESTERKALYYVTVSGGRVVVLNEYGELLETLYEYADFLPGEDIAVLRAGLALYSKAELDSLREDLN